MDRCQIIIDHAFRIIERKINRRQRLSAVEQELISAPTHREVERLQAAVESNPSQAQLARLRQQVDRRLAEQEALAAQLIASSRI